MSWRDGLGMRSVISTTALSLHYLHLYKFSRCFGRYDYLSGSAREANSAWLLCRYLHRRHHLRLFPQFRQKITATRSLLNILWYMRPCKLLQSSRFNHIQSLFDSDFFFSFEKSIFLVTVSFTYLTSDTRHSSSAFWHLLSDICVLTSARSLYLCSCAEELVFMFFFRKRKSRCLLFLLSFFFFLSLSNPDRASLLFTRISARIQHSLSL